MILSLLLLATTTFAALPSRQCNTNGAVNLLPFVTSIALNVTNASGSDALLSGNELGLVDGRECVNGGVPDCLGFANTGPAMINSNRKIK